MAFKIEFRGSVRNSGKDDFWCSWTEPTLEVAHAAVDAYKADGIADKWGPGDHAYIVGPDGKVLHHEVHLGKPRIAVDGDTEFAMQQGMAFGINAYNEAILMREEQAS